MKLIFVLILSMRVLHTICQSSTMTLVNGEGTTAYLKLPDCNPLFLANRRKSTGKKLKVELSLAYNGTSRGVGADWTKNEWHFFSLSKSFPEGVLKGRTVYLTSTEPIEWHLFCLGKEFMLPGGVQETNVDVLPGAVREIRHVDVTAIVLLAVSCVLFSLLIYSLCFIQRQRESYRKLQNEIVGTRTMRDIACRTVEEPIYEEIDEDLVLAAYRMRIGPGCSQGRF